MWEGFRATGLAHFRHATQKIELLTHKRISPPWNETSISIQREETPNDEFTATKPAETPDRKS
jgi:hypothetical protein